MNSSISSSESRSATVASPQRTTSSLKTRIKVALGVMVVLLITEAGFRIFLRSNSADEAHLRELSGIPAKLAQGSGLRVLFLGNSLTRMGIDVSEFERQAASEGMGAVRIECVYPDDSCILEWYHAFRHYFVKQKRLPEVVVIGFAVRQIEDFRKIDPCRLALHYGGWSDMPEIFREDVRSPDDRVEYLLALVSEVFGNHTRIKKRALDAIIPHYRDSAQHLNDMLKSNETAAGANHVAMYTRLQRFLNLARQNLVHVVVVAMPLPQPYPLDPALPSLVIANNMTFLDCRHVSGMREDDFPDGFHLGSQGARLYTRLLAKRMAETLSSNLGRGNVARSVD